MKIHSIFNRKSVDIKLKYSIYLTYSQKYRNDPKFQDKQVWANSADPDQTAPRGAV